MIPAGSRGPISIPAEGARRLRLRRMPGPMLCGILQRCFFCSAEEHALHDVCKAMHRLQNEGLRRRESPGQTVTLLIRGGNFSKRLEALKD
jgi:hypothetical protein